MIINNVVNQHNVSQKPSINMNNEAGSFANILQTQSEQAKQADLAKATERDQADFTKMTRQEMFDWMNNQIRSGKMTLDESSPFMAMTIKISAETGKTVDMATDTTQVNFTETARDGIDGALSRNDQELAERLQTVLEIMQKNQGLG